MQPRKTFSFTCTVASAALALVLAAGLSGCREEEDAGYRYTQEYSLLINNHSNKDIILIEVQLVETDGGVASYRTEFHNLYVPAGTMGYEMVIAQRMWRNPSSPDFKGPAPLSVDIEDAAGHRETFTYEWWNADTWRVGDATYYRLTIDFQG